MDDSPDALACDCGTPLPAGDVLCARCWPTVPTATAAKYLAAVFAGDAEGFARVRVTVRAHARHSRLEAAR